MALVYGWKQTKSEPQYYRLQFERQGCKLIVWYDTMAVQTSLKHPKLGNTTLVRKAVDLELLEAILEYPRVHTDKGFLKHRQGKKVPKPVTLPKRREIRKEEVATVIANPNRVKVQAKAIKRFGLNPRRKLALMRRRSRNGHQ